MPVVDASVMTAYFKRDDAGHPAASAGLGAALRNGHPIIAPNVVLAEVGAAVRRSTGDAALGHAVVTELQRMPGLHLVPVSNALALRASEIAVEHGLRGCDALYIAVAEESGEILVTLDEEQLTRGAAVVRTGRPAVGYTRP